jgi:8-hydroxy-5-deazaflavin:NADPH oxidoreductase
MANQKIGIIGSGTVSETLGNGFLKHGHEVMRGSRDPKKLEAWREKAGERASVGTFAETAAFGDIVVLAVKGTAAISAAEACDGKLAGKTVIDTTNPIADAPPDEGMLSYFTGPNESLIERLQAKFPDARFVKAFSSVGSANMVNPDFGGTLPTMFICGDDAAAKADVTRILGVFGWEVEDLGSRKGGRAIEPLCITWCAGGFLHNRWTHAFKVLKRG